MFKRKKKLEDLSEKGTIVIRRSSEGESSPTSIEVKKRQVIAEEDSESFEEETLTNLKNLLSGGGEPVEEGEEETKSRVAFNLVDEVVEDTSSSVNEQLEQSLSNLRKENERLENKLKELERENQIKVNSLQEEINRFKEKETSFGSQTSRLEEEKNELIKKIEKMKSKGSSDDEIAKLEHQIEFLTTDSENKIKARDEKLLELRSENKKVKKEIEVIAKDKGKITDMVNKQREFIAQIKNTLLGLDDKIDGLSGYLNSIEKEEV